MTTISMSSRATDPEEAIAELHKLAYFIEGLAAVPNAKVTVTGELNLVVDYRKAEEPCRYEGENRGWCVTHDTEWRIDRTHCEQPVEVPA